MPGPTDLSGHPWNDWDTTPVAPTQAAPPPAAPQETWNDKVIKMRQAGISQDVVDETESQVYQKMHQAGISDQVAAETLGVKPTDIPTIAGRYKAQDVASGGLDIPKTLSTVADAFMSDMRNRQREGITSMALGSQTGSAENLNPQEQGPLGALVNTGMSAAEEVGGGFTWLFSAPIAAVDVLAGHPIARTVNAGLKAAGVPDTTASLPRDAIGDVASQIAPFVPLTKPWPHALAEEYVKSGTDPDAFLAAQHQAIQSASGHAEPLTPEQTQALKDSLPAHTGFRDTAIQIAGPAASVKIINRIQEGLKQHWVDTGETPNLALHRADQDPHFRQQLMNGATLEPPVPAGSARSTLENGSQLVAPRQTVTGDPFTVAKQADILLPQEASDAVRQYSLGGQGEALQDAFAAQPSSAGAGVRAQLRQAAQPIRDALRAAHGPVLTLYRPAGTAGNITSFSLDAATALRAAGEGGKIVTEKVPVGDVAWATETGGTQEILVHTGEQGKPFSLSKAAPEADTLAHDPAKPDEIVPKRVAKPKPLEPQTDPRATLAAVRAGPADWLEKQIGMGVDITGGARTAAHNAAVGGSRTSEHLSNAAWDFRVNGLDNESAGLRLAKRLRASGVPFDQVEITPSHVHIGFKPDGVGNRGEIIYEGMKPGAKAHGVRLGGGTDAVPEGSLGPEEIAAQKPEEGEAPTAPEAAPPSGFRAFLADEEGSLKLPDDWEEKVAGLGDAAKRALMGKVAEGGEARFSDDGEAIMRTVALPPEKAGWYDSLKQWGDTAYQSILEKNHYVMKLTRLAQDGGMLPDDAQVPLQMARQVEYVNSKARANIDGDMTTLDGKLIGPGMMKVLEPFKNETGNVTFQAYNVAKAALEYAGAKMKHPVDVTTAFNFVSDHAEKYEEAFQKMVAIRNQSLHWLTEAGIHSQSQYDAWVDAHPNYVPQQRALDNTVGAKTSRGMAAFDPVKTLHGDGELPIKNIWQQDMQQIMQRRILATEAMAGNSIGAMARDFGILEPTGKDMFVQLKVSAADIFAKDYAPTADDLDHIKLDDDLNMTISRMLNTKLNPDEFPTFADGVMTKLTIAKNIPAEQRPLAVGLIKTLRATDSGAYNVIKTVLTPLILPAKLLRSVVSLPPSFSLRILEYDSVLQAATNKGIATTATENIVRTVGDGLWHAFGQTSLWNEAKRAGLMTDVLEQLSDEDYIRSHIDQKDPTFLNGVWNGVGNFSGVMPLYRLARNFRATMGQVIPTGVYAAAKRASEASGEALDPYKTGFNMSEAVFHRPGYGGDLGRTLNSMAFPFLAYAKMLRTAAVGMVVKPNPVLYGWGGVMATVTLANWYQNKDQEWYKALPDWQKDKVIFEHFGPDWEKTDKLDVNGNPIWIPHGYTVPIWEWTPLLSIFFSALPRRMAQAIHDQDPTAIEKGWGATVASGLTPPGMTGATALAPLVENMANKSFLTNQPLASDSVIKAHSTPEQLTPYTSGTAHLLAQVIGHVPILGNVAPWQIDNVIKTWTGKPGQVALQLIDQAAEKLGTEPRGKHIDMTTPEVLEALIGGSAFTQYQPGANTQQMRDYWTLQDNVDQQHGDIVQAMKDDDFARFSKLVDANPVTALIERDSLTGVAQPANAQQYFDKIEDAAGKVDQDKLGAYEEASKAAKNELKALKFIESLPIRADAAKVDPANIYDAASITNDDKRQLMIGYGTTAAILAEGAMKAAHDVGIK